MIVMEHVEGQPLKKMLDAGKLPLEDAKNDRPANRAGHGRGPRRPDRARRFEAGQHHGHAPTAWPRSWILAWRIAIRTARPTAETGTWETADPAGLSGTPDYMSPEQARGEPASSHSDVFALGLMIYEMLTGQKADPRRQPAERAAADRHARRRHATPTACPSRSPRSCAARWSPIPAGRDITMSDIVELLEWRDYALATS